MKPWRFIVLTRRQVHEAIEKAAKEADPRRNPDAFRDAVLRELGRDVPRRPVQ